jgi:hypothetical protein
MLKQVNAWHRGNRKGSVLLTVVIMVMVLFTLTTICLDVIHHSTKVSSKNVQKTQAKLTAEKALTEFIDGYKAAKEIQYADDNKKKENLFIDMMNEYASGKTEADPTIIEVSMVNQTSKATQTDFDHNFGKTELHIYKTGATSFVVESICTFGTQTQTASAFFQSVEQESSFVSHTVESQLGKMIYGGSMGAEDQLTNGVDGSIYIEKNTNDNSIYKKLSRSNLKAHLYSEFSVRLDDNYSLSDMRNTSHGNNKFFDRDTTGWDELKVPITIPDPEDETKTKTITKLSLKDDFDQAPTLITMGYLNGYNTGNKISTNIGKLDSMGRSPLQKNYDPTNLGNYDGFVKVDKKLLLTSGQVISFGEASADTSVPNPHQIDIYAHGLVLGKIPSGEIDGHDFTAEADMIRAEFPQSGTVLSDEDPVTHVVTTKTLSGFDDFYSNTEGKTDIHGNVYSYAGDNAATQDGSVTLTGNTELYIDGDLYVKGNIYLINNGSQPKITCNNLYCTGYIYTCTGTNDSDFIRVNISSCLEKYKIKDGKIVTAAGADSSALSSIITVKGTSGNPGIMGNAVDETKVRNQFPKDGYDPQTGKVQTKTLSEIYGQCSANDIFTIDADEVIKVISSGESETTKETKETKDEETSAEEKEAARHSALVSAAKNISSKYADAMTRSFAVKSDCKVDTTKTSKFKNSEGVEKYVVEDLAIGSEYNYYQINGSVKLTPDQVAVMDDSIMNKGKHYVGYLIKLEKDDIVVCLPTGVSSATFRVDRSVREANNYKSFVYFMYYDATKTKGYVEYERETWGGIKYDYSTSPATPVVKSTYTGDDACLYYMNSTDSNTTIRTTSGTDYFIDPDGADAASSLDWEHNVPKDVIVMGGKNSPTKEVIVGDLDAVGPADIIENFKHEQFDKLTGDSVIMYMIPNDVGFTFLRDQNIKTAADYGSWTGHSSGAWKAQGLIYGINSHIKLGMFESSDSSGQNGLFGQVKGLSVNFFGDNKVNHVDSPMEGGSVLDFVSVNLDNDSDKSVYKLMYYQY